MAVIVTAQGCGPAAYKGGFDSANPAAKLYAIEHAARDGDRNALAHIVDQLDSDDPAVRFMAIGALQRLTGETLGYRHYDSIAERRAAIHRWKTALQSGELNAAIADHHNPGSSSRHAESWGAYV